MSYEEGYANGYQSGYDWLGISRAKNPYGFKHPSEPGGYMPGGPAIFQYKYLDHRDRPTPYTTGKINPKYTEQEEYKRGWHKGWRDGINQYVTDNSMEYPQI